MQAVLSIALLIAFIASVMNISPAYAATSLTVTPITWNVIGLDSNKVTVGPNQFPIGARVCSSGGAAGNVTASFVWDTNPTPNYINIRPGTNTSLSVASLASGACTDFYFEVEVTRDSSAYDTTRSYHIAVTADGGITGSTPTPRELYVEHLVSQSRNSVTNIEYGTSLASLSSVSAGGTMTLLVGNTYYIKMTGSTATNGYEQSESFLTLPNTIFQVLSASSTYTADTSSNVSVPNDKVYGDGCTWESNPLSPNYRSCLDAGKVGGGITVTYQVKIISAPAAPLVNPDPLSTLVYDFSGSSYHYNADFSASGRLVMVSDPTQLTIAKNFSPDPIIPNGVSALTFTITNPYNTTINGLNFNDIFPSSPGQMTTANTTFTTSGCGAPTLVAPVGSGAFNSGAASIAFSNGTVGPNSTCVIKVNVTAPAAGIYANTKSGTDGYLFVGSTNTNSYINDTLTVSAAPAATAKTCGLTLAKWTLDAYTTNPPVADMISADVTTAAVSSGNGLSYAADTTASDGNPQPGMETYGWLKNVLISPTTSPYLQFAIDTSKYSNVTMTFDATRKSNGPSNDVIYYSTDGTTWNLNGSAFTPPTSGWTAYSYDFTGSTSTTGPTYFRIYGNGANATSIGNDMYLDNINFSGCALLNPPTLTKDFSPSSVAVGATSTLTFTITNPNTQFGSGLKGISFSDYLPVDGLQGSVAVTNSSAAVTGTGTAFKTQLIAGSIVSIPAAPVVLSGTVAVTQGSSLVTGTSSQFATELAVGSILSISSVNYTVLSILDATHLTLTRDYRGATASGLVPSGYKTYTVSSLTDDTHLTLTAAYTGSTASNLSLGAGLSLASPPTTTCGGTVTGSTGGRAISLSARSLTGTVSTNGTTTVTGTGTLFTSQLAVGNYVFINSVQYTIATIPSDTSMTLTVAPAMTASGLSLYPSNQMKGTLSVTSGSSAVTGVGTNFSGQLAVGGLISINSVNYTVNTITSATSLTLTLPYAGSTASGLTFTGGLAPGKTCTVSAVVRANAAGGRANVSGTINAVQAGDNSTSTGYATANLKALLPPVISKTFSPNPIIAGGTSTLTFTITNPNQDDTLSGLAFTDTFPTTPGTGLKVAAAPNPTNTCGGSFNPTAVAGSITFPTSGTPSLAAGGSCTIKVNVTASTPSGNMTGTLGVTNNSNVVTGVGTAFNTQLTVGSTIYINSMRYTVASIASAVSMTLSSNYSGETASGLTVPAGYFNNSETVSALINGTTVKGNSPSDTLAVNTASPKISLLKQVGLTNDKDGLWYSSKIIPAGTSVYYKFTVENIGDVDFTSFNVTDPNLLALSPSVNTATACTWYKVDPSDVTYPFGYVPTSTLPVASASADPVAYCVVGPVTATTGSFANTATAHGTTASLGTFGSRPDSTSYQNGNFGHLPSALYPTMNLYNEGGAFALNGTTYLGKSVTTTDSDGPANPYTYASKATDDGVSWTGTWNSGTGYANITATCSPAGSRIVYGWFDWNSDGDFNDANESSSWTVNCSSGGTSNSNLSFTFPGGGNLAAGTYYTRFRIYDTTPSNPQPYGIAKDAGGTPIVGEIEDPIIVSNGGGGVSTPVTLSFFLAKKQGSSVIFTWSTETESGNVGFYLYVKSGDELVQILPQIIPSQNSDSLNQQDYSISAKVNGNVFYIEDVNMLGEKTRHGPFHLGQTYGGQLKVDKVDWTVLQAEHQSKHAVRQNDLQQKLAVPKLLLRNGSSTTAPKPTKTITLNTFPKPNRTPTSTRTTKLTATPTATATPMATSPFTATPTGTVEPTATPTSTATFEPTATFVPTATVEPTATAVTPATAVPVVPGSLQLNTTFNFKVRQTGIQRVTYETLRDAGLDLAGVPVSKITVINRNWMVPVYVSMPGQAETFGAGGFIEFYGEALDTFYTDTNIYTVQVSATDAVRIPEIGAGPDRSLSFPASYTHTLVVNNQRAYSQFAPGGDYWYDTAMQVTTAPKVWNYTFQVNGLVKGPATLNLVTWGMINWPQGPDHHLVTSLNGVPLANITFDGLVENTQTFSLADGTLQEGANTLQLALPADTGFQADIINLDKFTVTYQCTFQAQDGQLAFTASGGTFKINNLPNPNVEVYRMRNGGLVRLENLDVQPAGATFEASFAGTNQTDTYLVSTVDTSIRPALEAARLPANLDQPAQYLIIAHPDFISGLGPLVQARQAQGLSVSVVDVNDLYTKYTYGIFDPQAIQKYIAYASKNLGTKYVLLVGGDTYDYRNYLGKNSISFIPSLYVNTGSVAKHIPADPLYADVNGDNLPDLAIGRFPVRSSAELSMMIDKTLAYEGKIYGHTAAFASDLNDGIVSYKDVSNGMAASLPAGWTSQNIHLDDVSVANARTQLLASMNNGTALVTFTGHSGPSSWTFSNLFNTSDAAALTNIGKPFVVVQWGCWNTYYVDSMNNYLVQKFLFSGEQGAAAVLGATTLVDSTSEKLLGDLLTPRLATPGTTIGQALQDAKSELARTHPELVDVLLGWSLMGDPTLMIQP